MSDCKHEWNKWDYYFRDMKEWSLLTGWYETVERVQFRTCKLCNYRQEEELKVNG